MESHLAYFISFTISQCMTVFIAVFISDNVPMKA